jgi:hypothetical protein
MNGKDEDIYILMAQLEFENDQLGARMRDESQVGIKVETKYVPLQSNEMSKVAQIIQL